MKKTQIIRNSVKLRKETLFNKKSRDIVLFTCLVLAETSRYGTLRSDFTSLTFHISVAGTSRSRTTGYFKTRKLRNKSRYTVLLNLPCTCRFSSVYGTTRSELNIKKIICIAAIDWLEYDNNSLQYWTPLKFSPFWFDFSPMVAAHRANFCSHGGAGSIGRACDSVMRFKSLTFTFQSQGHPAAELPDAQPSLRAQHCALPWLRWAHLSNWDGSPQVFS